MGIEQEIQEELARARNGHGEAQLRVGWLYAESGDYYVAYQWFIAAMEALIEDAIDATEHLEANELISYEEIRHAYFEVGCWFESGERVPRNVPAAVRVWEVAAAMGHSEAQQRRRHYV